jgi:DNA (cytosine-5)-methyltransferase 1
MAVYYNEFDKKTAAWLKELVKAGLIAEGDVDERSITEVKASDLSGYTQCHFFAGIGGWSHALRLAEWGDNRHVWTGSCPCQPFSTAGKGLAQADERHLWPAFFELIRECRPTVVFGEQVEGAVGKGWLDGVFGDLEGEKYACGAAVLGAHSVGSPHIRQRLYWMAQSESEGGCWWEPGRERGLEELGGSGEDGGVVQPDSAGSQSGRKSSSGARHGGAVESTGRGNREFGGVGHTDAGRLGKRSERDVGSKEPGVGASLGADACRPIAIVDGVADSSGSGHESGRDDTREQEVSQSANQGSNPWSQSRSITCRDGKTRRIPLEPAFFPLADGVPARVVRLRGYGNAIVPQAAAAFIRAYQEARGD